MIEVAPSLLAADLANLVEAARVCEAGGADLLHVDVMDGHFVPNLTIGVPVVAALRRHTRLPLDVHLMVSNPDRLLADYLAAGADRISVHWEAATHLDRLLAQIREGGALAGIAINPATPVEVLSDILPSADFVLLMSVNPGFGGQAFLPYVMDKARRLHSMIEARRLDTFIGIDGGIGPANVRSAVEAGVRTLVAGSAVFGSADPVAAQQQLRKLAEGSA
ncbi:MAG: ribulose-phosphate 3-epimerase [Thermoanaerobaculia bacterium]